MDKIEHLMVKKKKNNKDSQKGQVTPKNIKKKNRGLQKKKKSNHSFFFSSLALSKPLKLIDHQKFKARMNDLCSDMHLPALFELATSRSCLLVWNIHFVKAWSLAHTVWVLNQRSQRSLTVLNFSKSPLTHCHKIYSVFCSNSVFCSFLKGELQSFYPYLTILSKI